MFRTILVEDKFSNLVLLEKMLESYDAQIFVAAKAQTVEEAIALIQKLEPDLVFLDIDLLDGDGFEVLDRIVEQTFEVIFTTTRSEHSLRTFDIPIAHYLLKPIDENELEKVIYRCTQIQQKDQKVTSSESLIQNLIKGKRIKKIMVPSHTEMILVDVNKVLYLEANRGYTQFYLKEGHSYLSSKPIGVYEKQLRGTSFSRIHDKYLVNLEYVTSYLKGRGGEIMLSNNSSLQVSTRRKAQFIKELSYFINNP